MTKDRSHPNKLCPLSDLTIAYLLDLGDSQAGIITKFEIAQAYNISSDKIDEIIETALGRKLVRKIWESV